MKLQRRTSGSRAQLSDKLLAYATATLAVTGAASTAKAQVTLDEDFFNQSPNSFGGNLPSLTMGYDHGTATPVHFTIGGANFSLVGNNHFSTSTHRFGRWTSWGQTIPDSTGSGSHYEITTRFYTNTFTSTSSFFGGKLGIKASGANFSGFGGTAYLFDTSSGGGYRAFSGDGSLAFTTDGGGFGTLNLHLGEAWFGPEGISLIPGGEFTSAVTAVPEPASVAYGLGLVALGFAGVREHRRRRSAARDQSKNES